MKETIARIFLKYLQFLTKNYIKRYDIDFIGLTGSVGKTTLTIATYSILSKKYKAAMTYKAGHGLNSETGIPFAILDVHIDGYSPIDWLRYLISFTFNFLFKKCSYEKFVIEMGVDKPNDMDYLLSLFKPKVGIFLSLAKVHGANFESLLKKRRNGTLLSLIFEEKAKLIESIKKDGWIILNYDDKRILELKNKSKAHLVTFGLSDGADILGKYLDISEKGFKGKISFKGQEYKIENQDYLVNSGTFTTLLAAFAVGQIYDIKPSECVEALENMKFPPGRMTKIKGIRDSMIIDSSYNSSLPALEEALDNLALFRERKKIAVLGDMRELGLEEKREHEEAAIKAVDIADEMVVIGPAMKKYFMPRALKLGYKKDKIHHFNNTWKALAYIKDRLIKGGEAVLVKGSQNTLFLEIIVEGLMKDKSDANEMLPRRGAFWDKKRIELKE